MSKERFELNGLPTAIGSMPHVDAKEACSVVLAHLPEIPAWPQLPARSFRENMYAQYSEGFPGVVLEEERIWVDRTLDLSEPLEKLYAAYLENSTDQAAFGDDYAGGFCIFLDRAGKNGAKAIKGQVTGPISFGLSVTDQNRRPLLYDDVLADAIARHLRLKASWQEKALRRIFPTTIISIDEPYLASLGSAFVSIPREQVVALLEEVLGGISGLKAIHCCGNTDWAMLLQTSIDILSFDAYSYGEALSLYPTEVGEFLDRGGVIAWGIVPNDEQTLASETEAGLMHRLSDAMDSLSKKGVDHHKIQSQCLITPCCGLASISPEAAARALELTSLVSAEFRKSINVHA